MVVDDTGSITGIQGNILETHLNLSKAKDAIADGETGKKTYYKDFLALNSSQIYAGANPSSSGDSYYGTEPIVNGFTGSGTSPNYEKISVADGLWGQDAQGINFASLGNVSYTFLGGKDYSSGTGNYTAALGSLLTSYNLFDNRDDHAVDFLTLIHI